LSKEILPILAAQCKLSFWDEIKDEKNLTLSLNGLTVSSGTSIYAVMIQKRPWIKGYIGKLNLTEKRHTSINI
jgi:hypothetical protein